MTGGITASDSTVGTDAVPPAPGVRMHLLTVPGIHNSGPGHWQTRWEEVPGRVARRFAPSSWDEPEAWDWVAAVERDLADLGPDTVGVAHSMGALAGAPAAATPSSWRTAWALWRPPTSPRLPAASGAWCWSRPRTSTARTSPPMPGG